MMFSNFWADTKIKKASINLMPYTNVKTYADDVIIKQINYF